MKGFCLVWLKFKQDINSMPQMCQLILGAIVNAITTHDFTEIRNRFESTYYYKTYALMWY